MQLKDRKLELTESSDMDTFVVHLSRGMNGVVKVTSVELILSEMRNRYSFKAGQEIEDVFSIELAAKIQSALTSIGRDDRMVSLPEFEVTSKGLIVSGLRILITRLEDGAEAIMLRFRHYVGAIKSAFKFDPNMTIDSASMREKIAVEVLRDIVTPLFDVVAFSQLAPSDDIDLHRRAIEERLGRISSRQEEINFYIGLLQRYVAGCRTDALERETIINQPQERLSVSN
ncbi:MAG: hypothetical protein AAGA12_00990 [Pseudomonadota bacterium]